MGFFAKYVRKWQFKLANKLLSAYHFKYFQNIQFRNHGIAPTPPYLPTLKAYPTPGVGGRFEIFSLKWRERMNLKVPRAILPLGCAILSTRAITVRGGWYNPPLGELGLIDFQLNTESPSNCAFFIVKSPSGTQRSVSQENAHKKS